jgi:hypothetical protein
MEGSSNLFGMIAASLIAAGNDNHIRIAQALRKFVPGSLWIACRDQFDVAQSVNVLLPFKEENNFIKVNRGSEFRRPFDFGLCLHHGEVPHEVLTTRTDCLRGRPRERRDSELGASNARRES